MKLSTPFSAQEHIDENEFDLLPQGWYPVQIASVETRYSKAGNPYLSLRLVVLDGEWRGASVFCNITLQHPSPMAAKIGQKMLAQLCLSAGIPVLKDTEQLVGKRAKALVSVRPKRDEYPAQNVVKKFDTIAGVNGAPAQQAKPEKPSSEAAPGGWDGGDELPF